MEDETCVVTATESEWSSLPENSGKNMDVQPVIEASPSCAACERDMDAWGLAPVFVCVECRAELCLACFIRKAEPGDHRKTHPYRVRCARPELVENGWAAADDLAMLDAIERVGLGNWADIATAVGRGHSAEDVERHYLDVWSGRHSVRVPPRVQVAPGEWVATDAPDGTPYQREVIAATMTDDELTKRRAALPGAELAGYMPLRGDFDVEHDNDAEVLIADMELRPDDDPDDRDIKRRVLLEYNARLEERDRRKRFVIERGFLDLRRRREADRATSPDRKQVDKKIRHFARYHSVDDHAKLVTGLVDQDRLVARFADIRRRIAEDDASTPQNGHPTTRRSSSEQNGHHAPAPADVPHKRRRCVPDLDQISDLERRLCDALNVHPAKFLELKTYLTTGVFNGRGTAAAFIGTKAQVDIDKAAKIYDFARSAGWVDAVALPRPPPAPGRLNGSVD